MKHRRPWPCIGALCITAALAASDDRAVPDLPPVLSTCYLHEPLAGVHTIRLRREDDDARGVLEFDANTVRFGPLGEELSRTQMEPRRVAVSLTLIGRTAGGLRVYDLDGGEPLARALAALGAPGHGFRVLAGEGECGPYRLVNIDEAGQVARVVTLEH